MFVGRRFKTADIAFSLIEKFVSKVTRGRTVSQVDGRCAGEDGVSCVPEPCQEGRGCCRDNSVCNVVTRGGRAALWSTCTCIGRAEGGRRRRRRILGRVTMQTVVEGRWGKCASRDGAEK